MALELCVLASGSSGNCAVVRTPAGVMLLDAGIGPHIVAQRLNGTGVRVADVAAICLTHLDSDHFSPTWVQTIIRRGLCVFCHATCVEELLAIAQDPLIAPCLRPFSKDCFETLDGIFVRPIALVHDAEGSHGFVVEGFGRRLGYATDLGHVPDHLIEHFIDLDVLALESNYDPRMQEQSSRPVFLKRRIMGGAGHLSNQQAFEAIRRMLEAAERKSIAFPSHIVLLHRSRQCNCPKIVRRLFCSDPRIESRLTLAEPFSRTQWLSAPGRPVAAGEQLLLAW